MHFSVFKLKTDTQMVTFTNTCENGNVLKTNFFTLAPNQPKVFSVLIRSVFQLFSTLNYHQFLSLTFTDIIHTWALGSRTF
jgi:hypothetical protein